MPLRWFAQPEIRLRQRGSILLLVLVAIIIMALATGTHQVLMRNEHVATRFSGNHQQARQLAESGIDYLKIYLNQTTDVIQQQGGLKSNPTDFQAIQLTVDDLSAHNGRFSILAPAVLDGYYTDYNYGLENESAKLNLNTLVEESDSGQGGFQGGGSRGGGGQGGQASRQGGQGGGQGNSQELTPRERLMMLPGMELDVADAILDWIDADDTAREAGAELSYYQSLPQPYRPRNGPIRSLDELLLVRGVTAEMLYGVDANRNFLADENETPRGILQQWPNTFGQLNRGWSAYLTVHSAEGQFSPLGQQKINLNSTDLQTLHNELLAVVDQDTANFIIAYRQYGPAGEQQEERGSNTRSTSLSSLNIDFDVEASTEISSIFDLVGARVSISEEEENENQGGRGRNNQNNGDQNGGGDGGPGGGGRGGGGGGRGSGSDTPPETVESPWTDDASTYSQELLEVLDVATVSDQLSLPGRVNINQASRPVLLTIPGMTETLVDQIISRREVEVDRRTSLQRHSVWLLADQIVTLDQMQQMEPYITAGGDVYSGQVVGFFDEATPFARLEFVLDRSTGTVQLLKWKDLSNLGRGFSLEALGGQEPLLP